MSLTWRFKTVVKREYTLKTVWFLKYIPIVLLTTLSYVQSVPYSKRTLFYLSLRTVSTTQLPHSLLYLSISLTHILRFVLECTCIFSSQRHTFISQWWFSLCLLYAWICSHESCSGPACSFYKTSCIFCIQFSVRLSCSVCFFVSLPTCHVTSMHGAPRALSLSLKYTVNTTL